MHLNLGGLRESHPRLMCAKQTGRKGKLELELRLSNHFTNILLQSETQGSRAEYGGEISLEQTANTVGRSTCK